MRTQLDEGRELDALMAQKLLGWRGAIDKHGFAVAWAGDKKLSGYQVPPPFDPETGEKNPEPKWWDYVPDLPYFSTDIAAIWPLWENAGNTRALFWHDAYAEWEARLDARRVTYEDMRTKAMGETAPLAMCRALLAGLPE